MDLVSSTAIEAVTAAAASGDRHSNALSSAVAAASDVANAHGSSSWLGLIARLVLWILQLISTVIYYALKLATISVPTLLYTLFSTSLTVTMNATTLQVPTSCVLCWTAFSN